MKLSLKGRALQLLAQRDQSTAELRRKLARHARAEAAPALAAGPDRAGAAAAEEGEREDATAIRQRVDALLEWLAAHGYLSDERFAESRIHARAARFGNRRIASELAQHGVELPADAAAALRASELERCAGVRARRFTNAPLTASEQAAQARFLVGRGFSAEVVRRVLRTAA